jgi:hypothetical protein
MEKVLEVGVYYSKLRPKSPPVTFKNVKITDFEQITIYGS